MDKGTEAAAPPARKGLRRGRIAVGVAVVVAIVGGIYWFLTRNLVSTDDAFIAGNAMVVSPLVSGTVVALDVGDNAPVHKGELMLAIDPRDYQIAADNAEAALDGALAREKTAQANLALTEATTTATIAQARSGVEHAKAMQAQAVAQVAAEEAQVGLTSADVKRYQALAARDFASRQKLEQAQAAARSAVADLNAGKQAVKAAASAVDQAQAVLASAMTRPEQIAVSKSDLLAATAAVEAAKASLAQARLNLSYTKIYAPHDGTFTKRAVNVGDVVQKNQNLGLLVFGTPWVTANFKETQLTDMRPGQKVKISIDAYPDHEFTGLVQSIQHGTGAQFSLLPPENATGNFVKVVQRVPVKIVFSPPPGAGLVLGLGMSVVPTVDVASRPEAVAAGSTTGAKGPGAAKSVASAGAATRIDAGQGGGQDGRR